MATTVPQIAFTDTGVTLPTEPSILTGVQADIDTAFGGGVDPSLSSPQGQLAQSFTAIIGDKNDQIAEVVNGVNPDTASGRWQDAIGRIYFIDRIVAAGTVVNATCTGLVGTVIPAGTLAKDSNGYLYASTAAGTISADGTVSIQFQNQTAGAIACPIGNLSTIYTSIIGWESITNPDVGSLGNLVETRAEFEQRRRNTVALNAVNSTEAIYAAVLSVPNVIDAYVRENPTGSTVTFGSTSYPLVAHSICASVAGGTSQAVAEAIWNKKSQGCNYNGNTTVTVQDTSGYNLPYPTYQVTYLIPASTPVYFAVQIANNTSLPSDIVTLVQNAIISAFSGQDGGTKARIASSIYAGRYYAGVAATNENVQILSILMGTATGDRTHTALTFGLDQLPTLSASNISVTLV